MSIKRSAKWAVFVALGLLIWRLAFHAPRHFLPR
jgi:hypothetical protein